MAKTVEFEINMKNGTKEKVKGIVIGDLWGIDKRTFTTETVTAKGEVRTLSSTGFYLTHLPTGYLVTNANTQKALKELCATPKMSAPKDLKEIAEAVGEYWNSKFWKG